MGVEVEVRDVPERNRYEAIVGDAVAGFIEYRVANGDRAFMHTQVSDEFEGKGVGSALARGALDDLRARDIKLRPFCPFVSGWIRRHQDYAPLVAAEYRDQVTPDGA